MEKEIKFSVIHALQFAEWIGEHYIKLHGCWVHRYVDQTNKDNWKDTGELFGVWQKKNLPELSQNL